ncbi:hypothetical protein L6164_030907 [Bauhinia variegata]|uniref:Uncharacterized protein n=1 Tax=Bauhinia variegata TaxID=167791 RepID=A0ACB9LDU9_BAUVA|nr:hypothetical protein L6164_030907 [Bauhinia variegata]
MLKPVEIVDVADSDFLNEKHLLEDDDDSDSDSDVTRYYVFAAAAQNRLFGRKRPLHLVLGSGTIADILLWRKKHISASILVGVTVIWFVIEGMGYSLVSFICDFLILLLAVMFLWKTFSSFINIYPPKLPRSGLHDMLFVNAALALRHDLNQGYRIFRYIATGRDDRSFFVVTGFLLTVSFMGRYFTVATIFYIVSVTVLVVPVLYEKNEDVVDMFAEIALAELTRKYNKLKKNLN